MALLAVLLGMVYLNLIHLIQRRPLMLSAVPGNLVTGIVTLHYSIWHGGQRESALSPLEKQEPKDSFRRKIYTYFFDQAVVMTSENGSPVVVCSEPYDPEDWYRERPG